MQDRAQTLERETDRPPAVAAPAPPMPAHIANVLRLQQTSGNAAVSRMLAVAREPTDAPPVEGAQQSRVAQLATQAGGPAGLRQMLVADPGLAGEITAYFAAGQRGPGAEHDDGSGVLPRGRAGARGSAEKNPTDPKVPLPGRHHRRQDARQGRR